MPTLTGESGRVKREVHSYDVACTSCVFGVAVGEDIPAGEYVDEEAFRQAEAFCQTHADQYPGHIVVVYRDRKHETMLSYQTSPTRAR